MEKNPALITTNDDLANAFRNSGSQIRSICLIRRPIFSIVGTLVKIDDIKLQIYEYPDEASRKRDLSDAIQARRFTKNQFRSLDKSIENEIHCWSLGRLNILYSGADRENIRWLIRILGPPYLGVNKDPLSKNQNRTAPFKK